jgi:tetratricopeptide (TPR) repeat protein
MELVRGVKITEYCNQHSLTTEDRLGLFVQVCQAVQHAHQKGIIHRDIKPSNILVTQSLEGVAMPMVIDFGVAKATTDQRLTDKTVFTAFEMLIGTPAYMSPEQAALSSVDVDTRTDIYSLGVLLYELLTSSTPFETEELLKSGLDEMRRVIREQEPLRPSTRLSKMARADLTTVAQQRQSEPPRLIHVVRGDLDWIVMKCLEKDRTRRYETVNGLAADVKRHLGNEPVLARPPSHLYEFQKSVRRHKFGFAAAAALVTVLAVGMLVSAREAARADREARRALQAEAVAKERLAESQAVSKFMTGVFQSPDPTRNGRTITVAETLDRAATNLDHELAAQPEVRAQLQATLGETYCALGLNREAIPLQEKARDYYLKTLGLEHTNTLATMYNLASSYSSAGRKDEALRLCEQALPLYRKVLGPEHPNTLLAMNCLASFYWIAGRNDEGLKLQEEALALERKVLGPEQRVTLMAIANLAVYYSAVGRNDEALRLQEEALTLQRKVLGPEHPDTLTTMYNLANSYFDAGREDEALKLQEHTKPGASDRALATLRQMVAANPDDTDRAKNLATVYLWLGQTNEHQAICRRLLDLAANSRDPTSHERAAKAYLLQAHPEPEMLKQAVASGRQALQLAATNDGNRAWFLVADAMAAVRDGKPAEAESFLDEVLKVPGDHRNRRSLALAYRTLARAHLGRTEEARADLAELEKLLHAFPAPPALSPILIPQPDFLAACLAREEAEALLNLPPSLTKP